MKWNRGSEAVWAIVIIAVLILAWISQGAKSNTSTKNSSRNQNSSYSTQKPTESNTKRTNIKRVKNIVLDENKSIYYGNVTIGTGNAKSEFQPYKEYITLTISNKLKSSVNISGWYLTNAKGERSYQVGNQVRYFTSDSVSIPMGTKLYFPTINNALFPILAKPGQKIIITTGSANYNGVGIPSYEENKCSGYLINDNKTKLIYPQPPSSSCPNPKKELGVQNLEQSCYDFVQSLRSCHTPEYNNTITINGRKESGYVDKAGNLTESCKAFLKAHYSYNSCVANHQNDDDFYKSNTWRVFLNRGWELWAKNRETITLYDSGGKIISVYSY